MIPSCSAYISRYVRGKSMSFVPTPGEHHFVSAYLVPRLYAINNQVPDFINPDGMKNVLGDIVYYRDGKHHFGIEVKLGNICLPRREFNEWIVATDSSKWPNLFVGIGNDGVGLATWGVFRAAYIAAVKADAKRREWAPNEIVSPRGYGPNKNMDLVFSHLPREAVFRFGTNDSEVAEREASFTEALSRAIRVAEQLPRITALPLEQLSTV